MGRWSSEEGTTLAELLVVMILLGVIGTITTVGVVSGFRAQLAATGVAETLDGTRIATQRVRDYVRSATEVCTGSTPTALVLWTDENDDGNFAEEEVDIFEIDDTGPVDVFQRRSPEAGGDVVQLIRDDIINNAVFDYDVLPVDQPAETKCTFEGSAGTGNQPNGTRVVDVTFEVENPQPGEDPLTTATQVRLRNAALVDAPTNDAPIATFTATCPTDNRKCSFDATASDDPDGKITSYSWSFAEPDGQDHDGDGVAGEVLSTSTGEKTDFTFPVGNLQYDVTLTVVDNAFEPDSATQKVTPIQEGSGAAPTAAFTYSCLARDCTFDASTSEDDDGASALTYQWSFGGVGTGVGQTTSFTFPENKSYVVTLTVTDPDGFSNSTQKSVVASNTAFYVSSLTGVRQGTGNRIDLTVALALTAGGNPGKGILVTFDVSTADGDKLAGSCTTKPAGTCAASVDVNAVNDYPIDVSILSITQTGTYVYDANQNTDDSETIS